ncbi:MAG: hypothetical protein H0U55_11410 [Rubrobacteraceae bacterium]|nr:hypothetical protein [Rubrobacteraceae bacterium]
MENTGGLGRHLAVRLAASGESVVDVPPKLSARVLSSFAGNARKNDGVDALATALAASRNERLAAVEGAFSSTCSRTFGPRGFWKVRPPGEVAPPAAGSGGDDRRRVGRVHKDS